MPKLPGGRWLDRPQDRKLLDGIAARKEKPRVDSSVNAQRYLDAQGIGPLLNRLDNFIRRHVVKVRRLALDNLRLFPAQLRLRVPNLSRDIAGQRVLNQRITDLELSNRHSTV